MKNLCLAVFTLLLSSAFAQEKRAGEAAKQPAVFVLTINDKEYPVTEGEALKLDGNFTNPVVSVKAAPYAKFDNGKVAFKYKNNSTYDYSETSGNRTWTFDDSDCVVFLFELDALVKVDAITNNVIAQFGKKNCKTEAVTKKVGDRVLSGVRINVTLAGQKLVQEYYDLDLKDTKTNIIAFQNLKKEDGSIAADGLAAADMVATSFKVLQGH